MSCGRSRSFSAGRRRLDLLLLVGFTFLASPEPIEKRDDAGGVEGSRTHALPLWVVMNVEPARCRNR